MGTVHQISDEDNVLRRVPINPSYIKPDGTFSSLTYRKRKGEDGISVDLEHLTTHSISINNPTLFKLIRINVGVIRKTINDGLNVVHDPIEGNIAHSLIVGEVNRKKQKLLVEHSEKVSN